jgi:hypothetical protein
MQPGRRHQVFCIAKAEDADAFCEQFGGEQLATGSRR